MKTKNANSLLSKDSTGVGLGMGGVFAPMRRWMRAHGGQFSWSLPMLRFFLFLASVVAVDTNAAEDVPSCPDAVPIQIMIPGDKIRLSAAEIPASLTHFRAFVEAVSKHIDARMVENKLCINRAKDMESMRDAGWKKRSLLQFVHWPLFMNNGYSVPVMTTIGGQTPPNCRISSPWIDLIVDRGVDSSDFSGWKPIPIPRNQHQQPVEQIRAIVRWNERQLLADQAVLTGAKNVPSGKTMPLSPRELDYFIHEYERSELLGKAAAKPIAERIPPDLLWLFRHSRHGNPFSDAVHNAMSKITGKEDYTKLVLALIDRCFASPASDRVYMRYNGIADVADPILLKPYIIVR
ncbi:MAG: hypothetical protein LBB76_10840 [Azoarcus sp.]|nr:hypothetical protein [Azoarcus sp.]